MKRIIAILIATAVLLSSTECFIISAFAEETSTQLAETSTTEITTTSPTSTETSTVPVTNENTITKKVKFTVKSSDLKRPTMLKKGASFSIGGKVKSGSIIKKIELNVVDLNNFKTELKYKKTVSKKSINLADYKEKLNFSKLPSGEKEFQIILIDTNGNKKTITQPFTVLGKAKEPIHITKKCKISVSIGSAKNVTDTSNDTYWNSGTMTITLPKNKVVDGIYIKWHKASNSYTLKSFSKKGKVLDSYDGGGYPILHKYYTINKKATKVVIKLKKSKNNNGICSLRVYEKGKVGVSVEKWKAPVAKECDLMVISAHRDDELLFFGGTIPYYQNVKHKNVYTVYMSGRDRLRAREALAGQWSMGVTTYPLFMGFPGGYHDGVQGTLSSWGGENAVLAKLVEHIRKYQPDVIVSHDVNGEYGHSTHITTSYLVKKAVKLAGDKTKYKSSYNKYGAWKVKKLYLHMYNANKVTMNWNNKSKYIDNKTPFQVATIAYDKHVSQHGNWSMTSKTVRAYPNSKYGLVYSSVGKDKNKNDFFENIK